MDAREWNDRYRASTVWSGRPNAALVAQVGPLRPGLGATALDLGCGEGADGLWLADRGWTVTGVDWAGVAVDRARAEAARRGSTARFVEGDLTDAAWLATLTPSGVFDLVTVAFLHPEPEDRARTYGHLPAVVAPGGHLLVVTHDPEHGRLGLPGPPAHRLLGAEDLLAVMDLDEQVEVVVATSGPRPDHGSPSAHDCVLLLHRLP